ncbi:type VI secretion system baseplate subunit TssG [Roseibium litorale]|uniref:Type VI secretion system baseplate subunit TssG n=1 Tax=Roseibium litorale TaxID=2803841 RepID=A0ABR9CKE0_9HYPH|nr:type VI secretion system baseplate subunit TssG [Roseibium litorale]MBD8891293.1 type VI secretion system baseplate subunit TssG [Roseibium litorale]
MAGQEREADADLSRLKALEQHPEKHHIFQAMRLIEAAHAGQPRLGRSRRPAEDAVRLGQAVELAFPTSTISAFETDPETGRHRLTQHAFGLFGPHGALPLHLTDYARDRVRNHRDTAFSAFADLFHHRMISLFYRAWTTGEPAPSFDRADDDPFGEKLDAIAGIAGESFQDRDAMPDLAKRHFAGLLASTPRSEAGLKSILQKFFRAEISIESFAGSWLHLEPHDRGQLGQATLGGQASLGEKVWSREAKFRIRIGPLSLEDYRRLLPGGQSLKRLAAILRNFTGDTLEWEANLVLRQDEVPPTVLGQSGDLGLTSWIGQRPATDADDLYLTAPQRPAIWP